jgi:hypothetical protein
MRQSCISQYRKEGLRADDGHEAEAVVWSGQNDIDLLLISRFSASPNLAFHSASLEAKSSRYMFSKVP